MNEALMKSNQGHADAVARAAHAFDVAVMNAHRDGLTIKVAVLEFDGVGQSQGPRPQLEVSVLMPLYGSAR